MKPKAVIFDLDGTLLNTLNDLADSCNRQLEKRGLPEHPVDAYGYFVGNGARHLVQQVLPQDSQNQTAIDNFLEAFRADYRQNCFNKTAPYPGVMKLLANLKAAEVPLGVLSNKPDAETCKIVNHYFPKGTFTIVRGQIDGIPHKPDPAGVYPVLEELKAEPPQTAFVGDTMVDMKTAVTSGCVPIGVLWGFRDRAELKENGAQIICENVEALVLALGL